MARPWLVAAFLLCVASAHTARALDADAAVIDLDDSNWKDLVIENGREAWVVSFGADGCAPCAQMAPTFAKAAKHMGGIINFGHVHVGDASIKLAQSLGLTKVPHVVGLPAHKTLNPYTKKSEKIAVEYRNSTASHKRIAEFAATLLPEDRVTRIADADALARARTDAGHLPVAVLVTAKETTGSLFKSLALRFRGRVAFAEVSPRPRSRDDGRERRIDTTSEGALTAATKGARRRSILLARHAGSSALDALPPHQGDPRAHARRLRRARVVVLGPVGRAESVSALRRNPTVANVPADESVGLTVGRWTRQK